MATRDQFRLSNVVRESKKAQDIELEAVSKRLRKRFEELEIITNDLSVRQKLEILANKADIEIQEDSTNPDINLKILGHKEYQSIMKDMLSMINQFKPLILKEMQQRSHLKSSSSSIYYTEMVPHCLCSLFDWFSSPNKYNRYPAVTILRSAVKFRFGNIEKRLNGGPVADLIVDTQQHMDDDIETPFLEQLPYFDKEPFDHNRISLITQFKQLLFSKVEIIDTQNQEDATFMMIRDLIELYYGMNEDERKWQIEQITFKENPDLIDNSPEYKRWRGKIEDVNKKSFVPLLKLSVEYYYNPKLEYKKNKKTLAYRLGLQKSDLIQIGETLIALNEISSQSS